MVYTVRVLDHETFVINYYNSRWSTKFCPWKQYLPTYFATYKWLDCLFYSRLKSHRPSIVSRKSHRPSIVSRKSHRPSIVSWKNRLPSIVSFLLYFFYIKTDLNCCVFSSSCIQTVLPLLTAMINYQCLVYVVLNSSWRRSGRSHPTMESLL